MSQVDLKNVYKTKVVGGAAFATGPDGGRPIKVSSNKHWNVTCALQKRVVGPKVPQSRFFEYEGDEDYLWMFADEVHYITPGDTCKCNYKQNGEFDFCSMKDVSFIVTDVKMSHEDYRMVVQGKVQ
jgi:hypothetical protein|tara:strand:- start:1738 stop:2115 length:378 start_codon:yes stop_codon:yes gene_type:complete